MPPEPPAPRRPSLVPVWLDRLASVGWRVLVTIALALVVGAIAYLLASVTVAILISLILGAALAPIAVSARAAGRSRSVAAAIACALGYTAIVAVAVLLLVALLPSLRDLIAAVVAGVEDLGDALSSLGAPDWVMHAFDQLRESVRGLLAVDPTALLERASFIGTVVVLATFLTFFVLQDGDRGWAWGMSMVEPRQAETLTDSAVDGLERVGSYVRRTAALAAMDAIVAGVLLLAAGVPLAAPLTALVFLAGFVPYLGAIVATAAVGLAVLAMSGPAAAAVLVGGLVLAAVLEPRLLRGTPIGDRGDVNPVLVVIVIPAAGELFGLLGLVTALPVVVFALAVFRSILRVLEMAGGVEPASHRPGDVPVWLDQVAQWSWRALVVVGLIAVAVQVVVRIPAIVVPAVLATVIAATLLPLVTRLRGRGWRRHAAAATATIGATAGIVLVVGATVAWTLAPLRDILATSLEGAAALDLAWLEDAVGELGLTLTLDLTAIIGDLLALALATLLTLLLTYFFLADGETWWDAATRRLRGARGQHLDDAGGRAVGVLSGYMVGTALISLFGAVTSWLIMVLLGLPLAVPIAVLTFFGGFIPYIGSFITTALAFLVAVAVGEPSDIAIMAVYTVVFNLVQGSFVAPIVYGRALSLHPAIVLLAVPVGGAVAGILGMFLVVPIAAIVSATWRLVLATIEADDPPGPLPDGDEQASKQPVPAGDPAPAPA